MDWDAVAFNICAFIAGLFVLEFGADKFIDHTAVVARRLNVSQTLIALLTAGAEWEELAVVVAANVQKRPALALGNIIGSCIANVLGAFSLGLIFYSTGKAHFDRSAKIYTGVLLAFTTVFVSLAAILKPIGRIGGWILITSFVVYMVGIGYSIYKGVVTPPEDDSDSDSDSGSDSDSDSDSESGFKAGKENSKAGKAAPRSADYNNVNTVEGGDSKPNDGLLPVHRMSKFSVQVPNKQPKHSLIYHIVYLILGFIALSISGYVLSHSISTIGDAVGMSESVLGVTVLSFATTLPEKLVAVLSGSRGHGGLMVANTAGSNIFLLTLCAGLLYLTTSGFEELASSLAFFDILALWLSSLTLFLITIFGGQRWVGVGLFLLYIGFVVFEFVG